MQANRALAVQFAASLGVPYQECWEAEKSIGHAGVHIYKPRPFLTASC